jgi:hypothetical protein
VIGSRLGGSPAVMRGAASRQVGGAGNGSGRPEEGGGDGKRN